MSMTYIRSYFGVNLHAGDMIATQEGCEGKLLGSAGSKIRVRFPDLRDPVLLDPTTVTLLKPGQRQL